MFAYFRRNAATWKVPFLFFKKKKKKNDFQKPDVELKKKKKNSTIAQLFYPTDPPLRQIYQPQKQ